MRGKVNIQMANYSSFARYSETSVVPSQLYWRMFIPGRENKTHENWTSEILSLEQVFNLTGLPWSTRASKKGLTPTGLLTLPSLMYKVRVNTISKTLP